MLMRSLRFVLGVCLLWAAWLAVVFWFLLVSGCTPVANGNPACIIGCDVTVAESIGSLSETETVNRGVQ